MTYNENRDIFLNLLVNDILGSSIKNTSDEALFLELAMRGYDLTQLKESETQRITHAA